MSTETKVYVVTVGEYSDYHIVAIYLEEDKVEAELAAELIGGYVEEYIAGELQVVDPGMDHYTICMSRNGDTPEGVCQTKDRLNDDGNVHPTECQLRTKKDHCCRYERKSHWCLYWQGYAKSKEHAIRSAMEIRRQILAGQRPTGVDMGEN